jgi:hypothetical protein
MLAIPTRGFSKSTTKHNVNLYALCDWIEGSLLFWESCESISQIRVADTLVDNERYDDQRFALQGVKEAWYELRRGSQSIGGNGATVVDKRRLVRRGRWRDYPGQSFCVLLSLAPLYDWWVGEFGSDYTEQGDLFELLAKESFEAQFDHWTVYQTGWTRTNTQGFRRIVEQVADRLGERIGNLDLWDKPQAKEQGLDLLCYRTFPDGRAGIPVYMMQCASGRYWQPKMDTPNLKIWRNAIIFGNEPVKAFAMPFVISRDEFCRNHTRIGGLLLDRYRLLGASRFGGSWISEDLAERIIAWAEPRVGRLLEISDL